MKCLKIVFLFLSISFGYAGACYGPNKEKLPLLIKANNDPFVFNTQRFRMELSKWCDFTKIHQMISNPQVMQYDYGVDLNAHEVHTTSASLLTRLVYRVGTSNLFSCLGRVWKIQSEEDDFIGMCSLSPLIDERFKAVLDPKKRYVNMGICLKEEYWGQGFAREIISALLVQLFAKNWYDVDAVMCAINSEHGVVSKLVPDRGLSFKGEVNFPEGIIFFAPKKPVTMRVYTVDRADCIAGENTH